MLVLKDVNISGLNDMSGLLQVTTGVKNAMSSQSSVHRTIATDAVTRRRLWRLTKN